VQGEYSDAEFRDRKRAFFSRVKLQKLNGSKPRVTLDNDMLEHLNIVDPSVTLAFVGIGTTIELWRRDKYNAWHVSEGPKFG
jgi:DNA-binding transcriptional regulator/RsmH inhibitor MraZ